MSLLLKRSFDVIVSFVGMLVLSPIFLLCVFSIMLFSGFPIFFSQKRIGRLSKEFTLYKFRTMIENASKMAGGSITVGNDPRITPIGKFLRRWKLDEIPTLWNVLKGDMSFVGPRPDVPGYADKLLGESRRVLELRPGITGPATLKYANEEAILANVDDPIKYNDEVIFPDKIRINLDYMDSWSLWLDVKIIFKTIFRKNY